MPSLHVVGLRSATHGSRIVQSTDLRLLLPLRGIYPALLRTSQVRSIDHLAVSLQKQSVYSSACPEDILEALLVHTRLLSRCPSADE